MKPEAEVASQRSAAARIHLEVLGISRWKRWQIDRFLEADAASLHYAASVDQALARQRRHGGAIVVWAARETPELAARCAEQSAPLWRIEDGFIRSVGLGSNHVGAASLVLDRSGIYFDARRPSELEQLLQHGEFTAAERARAAALRQQIVAAGLTKYNVGSRVAPRLGGEARRRVLVVGQVEDDASIRHGTADIRSNLALLRAVRREQPQAWIVYKPHPDVEAGTRAGRLADAVAGEYADEVVRDVSAVALFPHCAAVHVMTSLAGFEALLHGCPTVVWGLPFYAGWGLSEDRVALARRSRRRALDELVAAALIRYPRYLDPDSGQPCEVEQVVARLAAQAPVSASREASVWRRYARLIRGSWRSLGNARA